MKYYLLSILLFFSINLFSQQCPDNLSFNANNFSFWKLQSGSYTSSGVTYNNTFNQTPSRVVTQNELKQDLASNATVGYKVIKARADGNFDYDPIASSIELVPSIGGYKYDYSVKLGNSATGRYANKIEYLLNVPSGSTTFNVTYAYALVLQNPGHSANDQPKFVATVKDLSQPTNSQKITCASKEYYVGDGQTYGLTSGGINFIDWQEVSFDLSQYSGKQISISFEVYDCTLGGHYGYAYVALRDDGCSTGVISGNNVVCNSSTSLTYSTPSVDGASYTWTLPVGWTGTSTSNSITVNPNNNPGGNITVTPSQSCGNITTRSLQVTTVNSTPNTPGPINGNTNVCSGSNNLTYFVDAVPDATSYNWTYPSGWTVIDGLNTNRITFNANSTAGNITVKSSNLCGNSSISSSAVSITNDALSLAGSITGVPGSVQCPSYFTSSPRVLTLGTSTGTILNWLSSTDGGINWVNISNSSSTLTITPTISTLYKAVVKNGSVCVEDESDAVLVDVYSQIQIVNQPISINTCANVSKTFSVSASGDGTLSYNWQVSSDNGNSWSFISSSPTNYSGYNSSTLTINSGNVILANNGFKYRCIISSSTNCDPVTSGIATLNVSSSGIPVINNNLIDQIFCSGSVANISIQATGPSLTYQWQKSTSLGGTYTNISGATSNILNISTTSASTNFYKCIITESCGNLTNTSDIAKIEVSSSSVVSATISSTSNAICAGSNKTFTISAFNEGSSPVFAWYKNGALISGQSGSTFSTPNLVNGDAIYATVTSNKACAIGSPASSNTITTVVNALPTINNITGLSSVNVGSSIILTNSTLNGTWSSATPSIAIVSSGTVTGISEGNTNILYSITDNQIPACSNSISKSITVNALSPSGLSYTTPNVYIKGTAITALSPTISGGSVTAYSITPALPSGLVINTTTGVISGTSTVISPSTDYTVTASNSGGSVTAVVNITVNDVIPSGLSYTTPNVYIKGTAITALSPTISGGSVTAYSITPALPSGLVINTTTGVISGTSTVISPSTDYTVTASNSGGSVTAVVNITVNDVIPSGLSYTTPNVYIKGTAITALSPTISGGSVTAYSITPALPSGLVINTTTGVISGTSTVISPSTDYTVTASNSGGSVTAVVNITVNDVIPSGLSYTTPNVYIKGTAITALSPTISGGSVTAYSITPALPSGLVINTTTGVISGTSTVISPSTDYTVTASNSGGSVTAVVNITVNDVIPQGSLSAVDYGLLASDTVKLKLTTSNGTAPFTIILSNSLNTTKDTITNLTPVNSVIEFLHKRLDTTKVFTIFKLIDANNNVRTSGFTKDTTIVNVLKPQILLTLKADPAVKHADNSFKTRLLLKIKNAGQLDLHNVQINANLSKVFPTGISYVLDSVRVLSGGLVLNPTYSGSGSATTASSFDWLSNASSNGSKSSYAVLDGNYLLNNGVNLNKTEEGEITLYVSIVATTQNVVLKLQFETAGNGVLIKNNGSSSIQKSTSKSDDGTDIIQHPDLINNGVPLPTYVPLFPNEKIGASLDVSSATSVSGGYQFHFTAKLKNYGNVNLDSIRIQYNFNEIYPSPDQAVLVGTPIVTRGNIIYNLNNFNGYNNLNLFNYGGDLQVGDSATFEYDLKVNTSRTSYTWQNYIVAYGRSVNSGVFVNDTSMAGINPDPNNDNDPLERFFTGATINFVKPLPPTVENKTYIFGQTKPSNIGGLVKSTPSGTIPVWCDTKTAACSINPPSTPTEIGIYVFALRSYDTTTLLYSDVVVYDTVIIKPPVPVVVNKKYIIGAVSNPINIVGQVTGMTGSTLKYFKSATLQSAIPVLGNVPGLTRYTTSQIVNGIESDTVGFTVTMLDPKTMLHLQKIAEEPRLQSNSTFNITYTFLVNNRTDEPMSNVLVVDNLQNTFPLPTVFTKVSLSSTGGLSINNGFNGMNDINLINSTSTLAPSATDTIRLTVNLQPKGFAGTVNNIAVVTATTPYGIINMNSSSQSFANESSKTPTPSIIPDLSIDIPEAFSPNRDGVNDRFIILKPFGTTLDLEVFNRWGNVVYANPNYNNEWDGRGTNNFIGQDLMDGGYYYTLKAKSINGNIQIFKGFVLIQR